MSMRTLMKRLEICGEHNYMCHGEILKEDFGATKEIMEEFWNNVIEQINKSYMNGYKSFYIEHKESSEPNITYISLYGLSPDRNNIYKVASELGVEPDEEWLDTTVQKLEEVINRVDKDMSKIQEEIVIKYNLNNN